MIDWEELQKRYNNLKEEYRIDAECIDTFIAWSDFMEIFLPAMKEMFEMLYEWKNE